MKITLRRLRRLVHEACQTALGWPEERVEYVYDVPDALADSHPAELGTLGLPKGPNSRDDVADRPTKDMMVKRRGSASRRDIGTDNKSNNDGG